MTNKKIMGVLYARKMIRRSYFMQLQECIDSYRVIVSYYSMKQLILWSERDDSELFRKICLEEIAERKLLGKRKLELK